jgi:predicted nucleic acid-binding protein
MDRVLLDTDILSEILKQKNSTVMERAAAYRAALGRYTFSVITVMEIVDGLHRIGSAQRIEKFVGSLSDAEVLPLDTTASILAGKIDADLIRHGRVIGLADPMIAAIALRNELPLVTGNTDHYRYIQDLGYPLVLDNWR